MLKIFCNLNCCAENENFFYEKDQVDIKCYILTKENFNKAYFKNTNLLFYSCTSLAA